MGNSTSANAISLSVVVIANWLLHNLLGTLGDWTMPPEVQSAFQAIVSVFLTWWLAREKIVVPNGTPSPGPLTPTGLEQSRIVQ